MVGNLLVDALQHSVELEQCALFVDSPPLAKAMTDAALFLRALAGKTAQVGIVNDPALPCAVVLGNLTLCAGCKLSTLLHALEVRGLASAPAEPQSPHA